MHEYMCFHATSHYAFSYQKVNMGTFICAAISFQTVPTKIKQALTGGGGGFLLACEDLGRMFLHSFLACVFLGFFF